MSDDTVVDFSGITTLDIPVGRVLKNASNANMTDVLIIGFDGNDEFFFASSKAEGGNALWLMEKAKLELMNVSRD